MRKIVLLFLCLTMLIPTAFAAGDNDVTLYRSLIEPTVPPLKVPKRVRLVLPVAQKYPVMVIEDGSETPEGTQQRTLYPELRWNVAESSPLIGDREALVDGNLETSADFDYDADQGVASILLKSDRPIETSRLSLVLDENVARPHALEIFALVDGARRTVVARRDFDLYGWESFGFPRTLTDELYVRLWHSQPLRVLELQVDSVDQEARKAGEEVVWLARPGEKYSVYFNAATSPMLQTKESGQLSGDEDEIVNVTFELSQDNVRFVPPDSDNDGVPNVRDNCVSRANQDQADADGNGRGDLCEDFDRDGVMNPEDNCRDHPNFGQQDEDGDGIGDPCDKEESRLTERLPWLPWAAMGIAGVFLLGLIVRTVKKR